jgi:hypothetical protein
VVPDRKVTRQPKSCFNARSAKAALLLPTRSGISLSSAFLFPVGHRLPYEGASFWRARYPLLWGISHDLGEINSKLKSIADKSDRTRFIA